jgi:hypothetical protein
MCWKLIIQFYSLACRYLVFPTLVIEDTVFPFYVLGSLIKDQLSLPVRIFFGTLCSLLLVSVSVCMLIQCYFGYYILVAYFRIGECDDCTFVLFVQDCFSSLSGSIQILALFSLFLWKTPLEFWQISLNPYIALVIKSDSGYSKEVKSVCQRYIYSPMSTAALYTITKGGIKLSIYQGRKG